MLKDQVIVVTGGGRGIGYAVAKFCLEHGASVVIADNVAERVDHAVTSLKQISQRIHGVVETVSTQDGANRIAKAALDSFGGIDALVNNASITKDSLVAKLDEQDFNEVIDTNLKGPFFCTKAVLPMMTERNKGKIINMIAASGVTGNPGQTNYAAAKAGVLAMTLTWSGELKRKNIQVNAVIPAAWTEMSESIPEQVLIKALGEEMVHKLKSRKPRQVAPLIGFLASSKSKSITGQCFGIAGNELSIWGFGKPELKKIAQADEWTLEEFEELFESPEGLLQTPVSPFL